MSKIVFHYCCTAKIAISTKDITQFLQDSDLIKLLNPLGDTGLTRHLASSRKPEVDKKVTRAWCLLKMQIIRHNPQACITAHRFQPVTRQTYGESASARLAPSPQSFCSFSSQPSPQAPHVPQRPGVFNAPPAPPRARPALRAGPGEEGLGKAAPC